MRILHFFATITVAAMLSGCNREQSQTTNRTPVDYVNPYIGNISHLLVPTFPTIQLPNSMLRLSRTCGLYHRIVKRAAVDCHQSPGTFRVQP